MESELDSFKKVTADNITKIVMHPQGPIDPLLDFELYDLELVLPRVLVDQLEKDILRVNKLPKSQQESAIDKISKRVGKVVSENLITPEEQIKEYIKQEYTKLLTESVNKLGGRQQRLAYNITEYAVKGIKEIMVKLLNTLGMRSTADGVAQDLDKYMKDHAIGQNKLLVKDTLRTARDSLQDQLSKEELVKQKPAASLIQVADDTHKKTAPPHTKKEPPRRRSI
jgi:hypothetical protein